MVGGGGGGLDSNIKKVGVLVVSLTGVNFRFWSRLFLAFKVSLREEDIAIFLVVLLVSFRGQKLHEPRPGVNFKILDEHPHLFYIRVPTPPRAVYKDTTVRRRPEKNLPEKNPEGKKKTRKESW